MKIIFAGTSEFGIPTLEKFKAQSAQSLSLGMPKERLWEIALIITQPDRPAGRDKKLAQSPIKLWAQKNNIPVEQPDRIKNIKLRIKDLQPDLLLVAAYGQIIPKEILDLPKFGSINIHGSILPKYRGASPIQAAILNGDKETGVTLLKMDEKLDHGPLLAQQAITIDDDHNYDFQTLYKKMSMLAADLVDKTLPKWLTGEIKPIEQNHDKATFTKLLTRQDAKIDWAKPALEIQNLIRALNPEPGTWTTLKGKSIKILAAEVVIDRKIELPGKIYVYNGQIAVKCLDNSLLIIKIKPEGKNEMTGRDFLNGLKSLSDKIFI